MLAPQPLFINCQLPPQQAIYGVSPPQSVYGVSPQSIYGVSPPQQLSNMMHTGVQFSQFAVSPNSSGRFDNGYESDASGSFAGTSPPGSASGLPPVIYQQHLQPYPMPQFQPMQYQQQYSQLPFQQYQQFQQLQPQQVDIVNESDAAWKGKFVENFSRFSSGNWHLLFVPEPPDLHNTGVARNAWRYRQEQSTSVTFVCRACRNSTLGTGQAVFWIYKNDATNEGQILLKLYSQKCSATGGGCGKSAADPIWQPAEAARALDGVAQHVARAYYGASDFDGTSARMQRRPPRRASLEKAQRSTD